MLTMISPRSVRFQSTPPREGRRTTDIGNIRMKWFQSTPPREGRRVKPPDLSGLEEFQSTPPREGRRAWTVYVRRGPSFNPRPRARGDSSALSPSSTRSGFNPRPRARGDSPTPGSSPSVTCFNPRPRARGDLRLLRTALHQPVSIHAPARGATGCPALQPLGKEFQSTPPREGRPAGRRTTLGYQGFNPRPRARGDPFLRGQGGRGRVSIHAPARGATGGLSVGDYYGRVSIHAPARGATSYSQISAALSGFNPRPRARGDPTYYLLRLSQRKIAHFRGPDSVRVVVKEHNDSGLDKAR